ncbi:hypothetical protein Tco_1175680 [Tanacetum coccineum]
MNINAASVFSLIQSFDRFLLKRKLGAPDKNITSIICTYAHSHDLWSDPLVKTLACGSRTQGSRCDRLSQDPKVISYFKHGFIDPKDVDEDLKTPILLIKPSKLQYAGVTKTLNLGTLLKESPASGNGAKTLAWQAPFKKSPASGNVATTMETKTPSKSSLASDSGKSFTSANKRERVCEEHVYIDLNDIDSDVEDDGSKPKKPMVEVKIEKEE